MCSSGRRERHVAPSSVGRTRDGELEVDYEGGKATTRPIAIFEAAVTTGSTDGAMAGLTEHQTDVKGQHYLASTT